MNSRLLLIGLDPQELLEQEKVDLNLNENVGQSANGTQHLANQTIGTAERGINLGTHTNESTGNC